MINYEKVAIVVLSLAVVYLAFFEPFTFDRRVNLHERVAEIEADYKWHDSLLSKEDSDTREWIRENQTTVKDAGFDVDGKLDAITDYLCGGGYIPIDRRDLCNQLK